MWLTRIRLLHCKRHSHLLLEEELIMFIMWNPGWRREVTSDDIGPDGADTGEMGNGCVNSV